MKKPILVSLILFKHPLNALMLENKKNRDISVTVPTAAKFVAVPNFAAIDQTVTEISQFFDFQDGDHPPSWIFKSWEF